VSNTLLAIRSRVIKGNLPPSDSQIADQIKVMNDDYKATGLTFVYDLFHYSVSSLVT
jgi:hypothetical protein